MQQISMSFANSFAGYSNARLNQLDIDAEGIPPPGHSLKSS
jgi:hypothetical protein